MYMYILYTSYRLLMTNAVVLGGATPCLGPGPGWKGHAGTMGAGLGSGLGAGVSVGPGRGPEYTYDPYAAAGAAPALGRPAGCGHGGRAEAWAWDCRDPRKPNELEA